MCCTSCGDHMFTLFLFKLCSFTLVSDLIFKRACCFQLECRCNKVKNKYDTLRSYSDILILGANQHTASDKNPQLQSWRENCHNSTNISANQAESRSGSRTKVMPGEQKTEALKLLINQHVFVKHPKTKVITSLS